MRGTTQSWGTENDHHDTARVNSKLIEAGRGFVQKEQVRLGKVMAGFPDAGCGAGRLRKLLAGSRRLPSGQAFP
jgi:hypothetical protein